MRISPEDSPYENMIVGAHSQVRLHDGRYVNVINFDNAATTPPLIAVMNAICRYAPQYASVHRGAGHKSVLSSELYEQARAYVKKFVGADVHDVAVFTKNTTEAINLLAHMTAQQGDRPIVLSTEMEHLANDLPWRNGCAVDYVTVDRNGKLELSDLEAKLERHGGRVRLVALTGASNVTGYINPIHKIAAIAHRHGAKILVDGAQLVPHVPFTMKPAASLEHIDYLAFSGHKMYAPFGTGVLIGPQSDLANGLPLIHGGGAVDLVSHQFVEWLEPPEKLEAGTPNMMGVVALLAAMKTLTALGRQEVQDYEHALIAYAISGLQTIPGVTLYAVQNLDEERVSLVSFTVEGFQHNQLAEILAHEAGIAVRGGLFCAHPYVEKLLDFTEEQLTYYHQNKTAPVPGLVRISFGLYNYFREIDIFLAVLRKISRHQKRYLAKYGSGVRGNDLALPRGDTC